MTFCCCYWLWTSPLVVYFYFSPNFYGAVAVSQATFALNRAYLVFCYLRTKSCYFVVSLNLTCWLVVSWKFSMLGQGYPSSKCPGSTVDCSSWGINLTFFPTLSSLFWPVCMGQTCASHLHLLLQSVNAYDLQGFKARIQILLGRFFPRSCTELTQYLVHTYYLLQLFLLSKAFLRGQILPLLLISVYMRVVPW